MTYQNYSQEMLVGIVVGLALAGTNLLRFYLQGVFFTNSSDCVYQPIFTVLLAKVVGGMLPMIAKRFNVDPAIMASPLIHHHRRRCSLNHIFYYSIQSNSVITR